MSPTWTPERKRDLVSRFDTWITASELSMAEAAGIVNRHKASVWEWVNGECSPCDSACRDLEYFMESPPEILSSDEVLERLDEWFSVSHWTAHEVAHVLNLTERCVQKWIKRRPDLPLETRQQILDFISEHEIHNPVSMSEFMSEIEHRAEVGGVVNLADHLGVRRETLYRWRTGKTVPQAGGKTREMIRKLFPETWIPESSPEAVSDEDLIRGLNSWMTRAHWSRQDVATRLRVSPATVTEWMALNNPITPGSRDMIRGLVKTKLPPYQDVETLVKELCACHRELDLSDRELAEVIGCGRSTLTHWLRGRSPSPKHCRKLYEFFYGTRMPEP